MKVGYVYIVECKGFYKIGYTGGKISSRLSSMNTGNPFKIEPILLLKFETQAKARSVEEDLHSIYIMEDKNIRGEWFSIDMEDIKKISEKYQSNIDYTVGIHADLISEEEDCKPVKHKEFDPFSNDTSMFDGLPKSIQDSLLKNSWKLCSSTQASCIAVFLSIVISLLID